MYLMLRCNIPFESAIIDIRVHLLPLTKLGLTNDRKPTTKKMLKHKSKSK